MENKLFVAGISYATTEDTLRSCFERIGDVHSVKIISDRETKRSKGFGFVEMTSNEDASAAIEEYNDFELDGRRLVVNLARPQKDRDNRY